MKLVRLENFIERITKDFLNKDINLDTSLDECGFDSLNVVHLMLLCESLFPDFDYEKNFIFYQDTTLREIYNTITK